MPRISRKGYKTITKTYHILIRGINKQNIFFDNHDRNKFLNELKKTKREYNYKIYSYVLMNNHVHIVIYDENDKMSEIMHRICTNYAIYFNKKYEREGHVFQNRFKNICVDTEKYLLNLIRYILRNPEKDGICQKERYNWSSYREYIYKSNITDTEFVLEIFGKSRKESVNNFEEFCNNIEDTYSDAEFECKKNLSDEEMIDCIKRILNIDNIMSIQNYNIKKRNEYIYEISKIKGISVKQISRLIGISKSHIYKIIGEMKNS